MKRSIKSAIALILAAIMTTSALASCKSGVVSDDTTAGNKTELTEADSNQTDESSSETKSESDSKPEDDTNGDIVGPLPDEDITYPDAEGDYGKLITNANNLWGGVNLYYESGVRKDISISNNNMTMSIHAANDGKANVNSIKNTQGKSYIENTMDVFVRMSGGSTYYSTASTTSISFDLYRFGMYYYELRAENQTFINKINEYAEKNLEVETANTNRYYEMSKPTIDPESGALKTTMEGKSDPRIYYDHTSFEADDYNYIAVDVRVSSPDMSYQRSLTTFVWSSDDQVNPIAETSVSVANDGEFHTYYFKIDSAARYAGSTINLFRFDFGGIIGDTLEYKNVRAVKADTNGAPDLRLCRYLHTYSDKNQQVIQISARTTTDGIEEIGMITKLDSDTVNAVIVKDKNGLHDTIDGIDWDSVEYAAFDVKGAGIFGYILLPDGDLALMGTTRAQDTSSGKLTVTLEDGKYVIVQSRAPKDGKLTVPTATDNPDVDNFVENFDNCADFYMGHRIYTDENHSFDAFIKEAELERNPLKLENILVDTENSTEGSYLGYDALRGVYVFKVAGSNFNRPYYEEPNKHFNVRFTVTGDDRDRNMYIMTTTTHGELQCAAILNEDNVLLPINVEVGKNFTDGGQSQYDSKDEPWSEAYFPMYVQAGEESTLNFLNLYMNWGRFPLKQISFIQLAPLYHLSTGVTETNCLLPWYSNMGSTRNLWTIPDHRPMSAPFWATQPNHTSGGDHLFLRYTDSEGGYYATEQKSNYISSYGPTYAEVTFDHLSDDNRIKVSYTHMEMPQTDENRAYYTMEYEVLEDISFNDFKNEFFFYSMNAYSGVEYEKVGYLDENNECQVVPADIRQGRTRFYKLGDNCPYFSFFQDSDNKLERGYVNLSFLIKDAEFNLQGADQAPKFVLRSLNRYLYLTLDYGEFTLKKGDTIKINALIMPWGSQESDYSLEDKNVRDVRENTLLNPLTAVPETGCTVIESDFLPRLRVTDGTRAVFTLKGASGNSVVEISGFKTLGIPIVYEKIDGANTRYNLSSQYYPDKSGYGQAYDGYAVKYAPDGTYTYSFVVDMSKGEDRTFIVAVLPQFQPEVEPEYDPDNAYYGEAGIVEGPNLMMDADALYEGATKTSASKAMDTNKSKVMTDPDGTKYFRFVATNGQNEAWFMPYTIPSSPLKTGRYLTIKFRLPSTNTTTSADGSKTTRFEIWTSTKSAVPSGNAINYYKDYLKADDQWRILVIDLAQMSNIAFDPAPNGDYYANHLRFDVFAEGYGDGSYIDIAYISFDDRAEDIFAYPQNKGFDTVTYYDGRLLDVATTENEFPLPKVVYEDDTASYDTPFDLYLSALHLAHLGSNTNEFGNVTYYEDDGYVRFNSHAVSKESDFVIYRSSDGGETGRYIVMKYRASSTLNTYMQIYATTLEKTSFTNDNSATSLSNTNFVRNGEWQIAIIDLSKLTKEFTDNNGKYSATLLRLDVFNDRIGTTAEHVDFAYVAMCDDLTAAITYDKTVETALVRLDKDTAGKYLTSTGEIYSGGSQPSTPEVEKPTFYLDPFAVANKAGAGDNIGGATVSEDGKYATVSNKAGSADGFFFVATDNAKVGRYIMIKYRTESADRWEWGIKSKGQSSYGWFYVDPIADGEWHTAIIDLSETPDGTFKADEKDGTYYAAALRWDIMNVKSATAKAVDIAFIALSDDMTSLIAANGTEPYDIYSYFDSSKVAVSQRPLLIHVNSLGDVDGVKAQRFTEPLILNKEHAKYPEKGFISTSSTKPGHLYAGGWLGTTAEADGFVYRVLDANGNTLSGWAELAPEGAYPQFSVSTEAGVINAVKAQIPSATAAYNFRGYADLTAFAGQNVTVELAIKLKDVSEAYRYFTVIVAEGITVTN